MSVVGRVEPMASGTRNVSIQTSPAHNNDLDDRVYLNIGGTKYTTNYDTLARIPNTLLSSLTQTHPSYIPEVQEYFFDRNPRLFNSILDAYRIGKIHLSQPICGTYIKEELEFWQLPDEYIASCCWKTFKSMKFEEDVMNMVEDLLLTNPAKKPKMVNNSHFYESYRYKLWLLLEDPTSSSMAMVCIVIKYVSIHPYRNTKYK